MSRGELRCPTCGSPAAEVRVDSKGDRQGLCRNPACRLNQDGVGMVLETMGAVVCLSLPTRGPRLQEALDILEGRAPPGPETPGLGLLDGKAWCGECGLPLLTDRDGDYCHIHHLPRKRLKVLLRSEAVVTQVLSWLSGLELACPECGPRPNPFRIMPREEFLAHVSTGAGVKDLHLLIQGIVGHYVQFEEHPAVAEAERIIRGESEGGA